jgi:hypothetical protein
VCFTFQKDIALANVAYFRKVYYHKKYRETALSDFRAAFTSDVCAAALLLFMTAQYYHIAAVASSDVFFMLNFMGFRPVIHKLLWPDT